MVQKMWSVPDNFSDNFLKDAIFIKDVRIKDYQEKLKLRDYEKSKLVDYVNSYKGKVKRLESRLKKYRS